MNRKSGSGLDYREAGVDIDAGNRLVERIRPAVKRTARIEVMGGLGGFGGLFHLGSRYRDPVLVSGTDGVGTKLLLARQLARHDTIGVDLVAMCVNDILVTGAEPLFFLDYYACSHLDVEAAAQVVEGIANGCEQAGCALIGGETAEMPGMYSAGDFDLAGFAVGVVERDRIIDGAGIDSDCVVVGLASSGTHSNGYSLIRKVLELNGGIETNRSRAETLLTPTRIYVRQVRELLKHHDIRAMAHITGGGLAENIIRVVPQGLGIEINPGAWRMPEIFDWLSKAGNIEASEMRRTFNLGIGFVLIMPESEATAVISQVGSDQAFVIGRMVASDPGANRVAFSDS